MRLPYATFPAVVRCVMITGVVEAVKKKKRKMNMSLNQHQDLSKHTMLTKLKPFYAYSTGKHHKDRIFNLVLAVSYENMRLQINSCNYRYLSKKLLLYRYSSNSVLSPSFCRLKWRM
jgi:hypothetical protein